MANEAMCSSDLILRSFHVRVPQFQYSKASAARLMTQTQEKVVLVNRS